MLWRALCTELFFQLHCSNSGRIAGDFVTWLLCLHRKNLPASACRAAFVGGRGAPVPGASPPLLSAGSFVAVDAEGWSPGGSLPSACSTGRPAAVVVEGEVELGPVEDGIPWWVSEGGSPDA